MNNKGQFAQMGIILTAFIGVVVGLMLLQAVFPIIGDTTGSNPNVFANSTQTMPTTGGTLELTGQNIVGTPIVTNATGGEVVPATNYTIAEGVTSQGVLGIILTSNGGSYVSRSVNVSYVSQPVGYVDNSGARGIVLLIPILGALAIMSVALVPALRSGIMDMFR